MFGWGKKKEIKETKVENTNTPAHSNQINEFVPIAVFVGVTNSENQIVQAQKIIENRAKSVKGIAQITTAQDGLGIATTLLAKRGQNFDAIFENIHNAAEILASELLLLGQCSMFFG